MSRATNLAPQEIAQINSLLLKGKTTSEIRGLFPTVDYGQVYYLKKKMEKTIMKGDLEDSSSETTVLKLNNNVLIKIIGPVKEVEVEQNMVKIYY